MVTLAPSPLRGVARRRAQGDAAAMAAAAHAHHAAHPPLLRPLLPGVLATLEEQDFLAALFEDLAARAHLGPGWRAPRRGADQVPELGLPIHRQFHVALFEACCERPGYPRLDPGSIAGAGLVIRREDPAGPQGWLMDGTRRQGWIALDDGTRDPDPAFRAGPRAGHPLIDALLPRGGTALRERSYPLFTAPPAVCEAAGRTVLYAVVPVTSDEFSEAAPLPPDFGTDPAVDRHLSPLLKEGGERSLQGGGQLLDASLLDRWEPGSDAPGGALGALVRQLAVECGVLEAGAAAQGLRAVLSELHLVVPGTAEGGGNDRAMAADAFLAAAIPILLAGAPNPLGLRVPLRWPAVPAAVASRLRQAAIACIGARFAALAGRQGQFEEQGRLYRVHAFVRTPCDCEGRLKTIWSDPSPAFRILPWWAGAGRPAQIGLPDVFDPAVLGQMKPGVAFQVPASLQSFLDQDLSKVLGGEKPGAGGPNLGIAWLCSFSIPIITICAFIVLSIILSLLNIVFRWLPFVKICLPLPKRS